VDQLAAAHAGILRGKVVLVDFWTYSCINCLRTLPYIKAWNAKYKDSGLVIIGVHTPEFPLRRMRRTSARPSRISASPIPSRWTTTTASGATSTTNTGPRTTSSTPPATSLSPLRRRRLRRIREVDSHSARRGQSQAASRHAATDRRTGTEAAPDSDDVKSPETYVGYERAQNFASPGGFNQDDRKSIEAPGQSQVEPVGASPASGGRGQIATSLAPSAPSSIASTLAIFIWFSAHQRLESHPLPRHLDGKAPGADHGVDTDADGYGTVTEDRLYQLIRQQGSPGPHLPHRVSRSRRSGLLIHLRLKHPSTIVIVLNQGVIMINNQPEQSQLSNKPALFPRSAKRRTFLVARPAAAGAVLCGIAPQNSRIAAQAEIQELSPSSSFPMRESLPARSRFRMSSNPTRSGSRNSRPISFEVTRHAGTERPYTGSTWNNHDHGFYRCICCDNALFSSETKFESGTGWPSFWQPIAKENIVEIRDDEHGHGAHRCFLPRVRCASRPCLR
jgi:methionine-R-sulfoxide reductase